MNPIAGSIPPEEKICVVIPVYRVENQIQQVIRQVPGWVWKIIAVDDASPDQSAQRAQAVGDERLILLRHECNQGVGGAVLTGFSQAAQLGATVLVKVDGDDQAPLEFLPDLLAPILAGRADYTKGNRFFHSHQILKMPAIRRFGNLGLSFLTKAASGYWNVFDPTNGFLAIDAEVFRGLDLDQIHKRYFFESSLLVELNLLRASVVEVPMPARYQGESSSLRISKVLIEFPYLLLRSLLRRLWLQYFVLDFSVGSLFMVIGLLSLLFGVAWGGLAWWRSSITHIPATTGTVMIAVMPVILGFQLLLQSVVFDVQNLPRRPRTRLATLRRTRTGEKWDS